MQGLAVLGATGTIGLNTLEVAGRHPDRFRIIVLTAHRDITRLLALCRQYRPLYAVAGDPDAASQLRERLAAEGLDVRVLAGVEGICETVSLPEVDVVMAGIVGAAGLLPTLAAIRAGKRVLLANKEPLVMAGALFMREVARCGATLIPVDSEHNAIFQCLPAGYRCGTTPAGARRLILTASGGPFRDLPLSQLRSVTPEQAVRHPNWVMGPKISIDSATMMNKGLELIEASWLFHMPDDRIEVLLHPQSVVHSLVEFSDGSVLAQLGQPDMRTPIANALGWPERMESGVSPLDLCAIGRLEFRTMDLERYPCLSLSRTVLRKGGGYPVVLNAANEAAVAAFLDGRVEFTTIPELIESCLDRAGRAPGISGSETDLEGILTLDAWARDQVQSALASKGRRAVHV